MTGSPGDDDLFTHVPELVDGYVVIPDRPGWGTEPVEEALHAHPPNEVAFSFGLLTYGTRAK